MGDVAVLTVGTTNPLSPANRISGGTLRPQLQRGGATHALEDLARSLLCFKLLILTASCSRSRPRHCSQGSHSPALVEFSHFPPTFPGISDIGIAIY